MSRTLTPAQVAMACQVSPITVRGWIRRKRIKLDEYGRIEVDTLLKYLDDRGDRGQRWDVRLARARGSARWS